MLDPMFKPHLLLALLATPAAAGLDPPSWTEPVAPFRIAGPIHYVGTRGLGAYLIAGKAGAILLDGTLPENAPLIERNIRALGFRLSDVKWLVNSHAHFDHAGGLAALKRDTGARFAASAADRRALETGHPTADSAGPVDFPPVTVDWVVKDGETLTLGEVRLTALLTPGHTAGCTSWTTTVREGGRTLSVIFPCSLSTAGNRLVGNRGYPGIAADYRRSFARLKRVHADLMLPAHTELTGLHELHAKGGTAALLDGRALPRFVSENEAAFERDYATARAPALSSSGPGRPNK